ncbi:DUF4198 domain-containing protein [Hymenobacter sp. B81]|uniref:DUF4198 domain-containing protein n=1 Tax=Hymenobacter sp. B81 TaxID=3344878 RepID=UPI0037DD5AAF
MARLLLFFLALLLALGAAANEFWLEPTRFVLAPGSPVHLGRWVGQNFRGQRWSGQSQRLEELLHLAPGSSRLDLTAPARAADSLRTTVVLAQPGTHLLALRTNEALLSFSGSEFTAYLQAENLGDILYLRRRRNQTDRPAREAYRRCAKTLLLAGPAAPSDTTFRQRLGHPLEIVAEQNPYLLRPGASLTLRVWADGQPAAYQALRAFIRPLDGSPVQTFQLRTNPNGRALLRLQQPATVLVAAVRMRAHPAPATADWQSTWASLTFAFTGR